MSTRAMRAALEEYRVILTDSLAGELSRDQRRTEEHSLRLVTEALAEVEAIEKAARVISADATVYAIERKDEAAVEAADNLLFAISEAMPPKT